MEEFAFDLARDCSPEFALSAACAIWPPGDARNAAIRQAASLGIDWKRLHAVAIRQGIAGLVHDGLRRASVPMPPEAARTLAEEAHTLARKSLTLTAEAVRLRDSFRASNIPLAFVKGPPLAMLAYGTIALRPYRDLDLLVPEGQAMSAAALLEREGYQRTDPGPAASARQIATWMRMHKDFAYIHKARRTIVELHWRLVENPTLQRQIPSPELWIDATIADGVQVKTLAIDDLLVYLTMHGAHHGWARMKWAADLAALLAADPARAAQLLALAERAGASRSARQLLLLVHVLFGTPLPTGWQSGGFEGRIVRWLARRALAVMTRDGGSGDPAHRVFGAAGVSVSRFLLRPDWRFKLAQLRCALVSSEDWRFLPLPPALHSFYPALRLPLWFGRRMAQAHSARRRLRAGRTRGQRRP